ncbi:MAG: hypothetical protein DCC75_03645 [Proteobacteria bacterium]|nr:MAG: hypothetical protein DCC75_03645 [Pseudomonadota bacterium]
MRAVQDGAKKASAITQQILDFSKSDLAEKAGAVNMTELITKTCQLLRGAISPDHKIIIQLPAESLYVLGVDAKLVQVVVNLMTNARDALGDSGTVKVGLERCRDINLLSKVFNLKELPCSEYLRLYVEDTGHGMTGEVMERMFEAYFSTKKKHGTGLGLSTVASIVRALGGTVSVSSKVGTGTSISVFLPELDWSFESAFITKDEAREIEGGNENILIIDDEDPVRNVLAISLEHLGYQVEMAASGVEALDMFGNGGPPADLVILDMLMPVLSGEKVFFELRKRNPAVKVLVISGYSSQEAIDKILKNGGLGFIQKPFTIEELAKKVRECLAAATKSA